MTEKGKILYSCDGSGVNLVKKNKKEDYKEIIVKDTILKLKIEKKGRGGKTVSLIYELPDNPDHFRALAKELKKLCGTGGSLKKDQIEVQGNNLEKIRTFLINKGYQVKG